LVAPHPFRRVTVRFVRPLRRVTHRLLLLCYADFPVFDFRRAERGGQLPFGTSVPPTDGRDASLRVTRDRLLEQDGPFPPPTARLTKSPPLERWMPDSYTVLQLWRNIVHYGEK